MRICNMCNNLNRIRISGRRRNRKTRDKLIGYERIEIKEDSYSTISLLLECLMIVIIQK